MTTQRPLVLLAAGLALLTGCPEETVTHTRIVQAPEAKTPDTAMRPAAPTAPPPTAGPTGEGAAMGAMNGDVPAPPKPSGAGKLDWTLPQGWHQTLSGGIRYATLAAPVEGNLAISVVVLAGPAGGELANVNRWRSQIGLPPLTEESLPKNRKSFDTKAGAISVFDFTSEGVQKSRVVAGILESNGNSWFFKMTGDAQAVGKAVPDFMLLLHSVHAPTGAN